MSMTTPLGTFPVLNRPYSNITPFTYRDGLTHLEVIEGLRNWIYNTLVPHIDTEIGGLNDSWHLQVDGILADTVAALDAQDTQVAGQLVDMTAYVDSAVASIINATIAVVDPVMFAIISDPAAQFTGNLFSRVARKTHVVVGATGDYATITAALAAFPAGNVYIELQAGTITEPSTIVVAGVKNVTIQGQGRDSTTVLIAGPFLSATANSDAWTLKDFHLTNTVSTNTQDGIKVDYPRRWVVSGMSIDGFGGTSIWYRGGIQSTIENNYIIAKDAGNLNGYAGIACDKSVSGVVSTVFTSRKNYIGSGKIYGMLYSFTNIGTVFDQDTAELCDTGMKFQNCIGELRTPYTEANRVSGIEAVDSNLVMSGMMRDYPIMTWAAIAGTDRRPVHIGHTTINPGKAIIFGNGTGAVIDPTLAPAITWGSGSPEAAITAVVGTIYIRTNGFAGQTVYIKQSATGNTGWAPLSVQLRTTPQFAAVSDSIQTPRFAGMQAWNTTLNKPVFSTGALTTSTWVFADGTLAHTPV